MDFYTLCFYFALYCVLGWCTEVAFAAVKTGRFVNRGFLNGPVCPIYGFGMTAVIAVLTPVQNKLLLLFLGGTMLTSALELATGFVLKQIFHDRWWDYSNRPFNVGGYICLEFSLIWGIACVLVMRVVQPPVALLAATFPHSLGAVLLWVFLSLLTLDAAASFTAANNLKKRLRGMDEIAEKLHELSDAVGQTVFASTMDAQERLEQGKVRFEEEKQAKTRRLEELRTRYGTLSQQKSYMQRRLINAFPHLEQNLHTESIKHLRNSWKKGK